jgi:hypothetical protein
LKGNTPKRLARSGGLSFTRECFGDRRHRFSPDASWLAQAEGDAKGAWRCASRRSPGRFQLAGVGPLEKAAILDCGGSLPGRSEAKPGAKRRHRFPRMCHGWRRSWVMQKRCGLQDSNCPKKWFRAESGGDTRNSSRRPVSHRVAPATIVVIIKPGIEFRSRRSLAPPSPTRSTPPYYFIKM